MSKNGRDANISIYLLRTKRPHYYADSSSRWETICKVLVEVIEPEVGQIIYSSILHAKYSEWCQARRLRAKGIKAFSQDMEKKYKREKRAKGNAFIGLKFKEIGDK